MLLSDKLATKKEYAPGIPSKERILPIPVVSKSEVWTHNLQHHLADRAGPHYDFRLADPKGNSHSWAMRKLPAPGETVLAVQQPTHSKEYLGFSGTIPAGSYGAGEVKSLRLEPTEVIKAGPGRVTFHLHKGHLSEEYSLIHTGEKKWILVNHTITRESKPFLPSSKPGYKEIPFDKVVARLDRPDEAMSVKIDGGHNTFLLESGKPLRVFSYRPTERATGLIEHTHRLPGALTTVIPKELNGTILRGEIYARDMSGRRPLPAETIGGMLNANVWLSRERQKVHGPLRAAIFDVVKWRGKNVENVPYADKLMMLKEVQNKIPWLELPDIAFTPEQKESLLRLVIKREHPQTHEGVVFWNMIKGGPPTKAKVVSEHDVIIKGFAAGKGELAGKGIGAIQYGDPKHPKDVKGEVGTGMSRALRQDMLKRPELYIGKNMKVRAQGVFPSGALRAPRFLSMHLDSLEGGEKVATFSSMRDELEKISRMVIVRYLSSRHGQQVMAKLPLERLPRAVREKLQQTQEKKADTAAQGPAGALEHPRSYAPSTDLDSEGRLRTNDEPNAALVVRRSKTALPVKKRKRPDAPLAMTEDYRSGEYPGAEPAGVNREFHANHENTTK